MDNLSTKLAAIFQNVNEWLKFAEAKNAVLLSFSGAGVTATITLLATAQKPFSSLQIGLLITTFLLCVCALICSLSFLPKTNLEQFLQSKNRLCRRSTIQQTDNLYYFGDIQKYLPNEFLESLNKHCFKNELSLPYGKECEDLAAQITVNAKIALRKFVFFTYALYFLIVSILAVPLSILLSIIF